MRRFDRSEARRGGSRPVLVRVEITIGIAAFFVSAAVQLLPVYDRGCC